MHNTRTLILFLALLLTSCTAPPLAPMPMAEIRATVVATFTATPAPAPTATATVAIPASGTAAATPTAAVAPPPVTATRVPTLRPSPAPTLTATPESPAVTLTANANLRAGPGTAYPVIGGGRTGQVLPVLARYTGWWQTPRGWVSGTLAQPNTAAGTPGRVPELAHVPAPPTSTPAPPTSTPKPPTDAGLPPHQDRVVLGSDTQYPVRARVVQGWDYEFVDLSAAYDFIVYRDVFGMLAHQIDDENIRRHTPNKPRLGANGPVRITLVDAQPHPDPNCPGWGWAPDRDTYMGDPLGMLRESCRTQHSLTPEGDGHGAVLLTGSAVGWGLTVAVGAYGPTGADWSTTYFAERIIWPATLGPADRPDFALPLYAPLGGAHKEAGRWVWLDPFVRIVPAP